MSDNKVVPREALEKAFADLHADQQLICGGSASYHNGYSDALKAAELYFGATLATPEPVDAGTAGLTPLEQRRQGARCGCAGTNDYCPCQNVPDRLTYLARKESDRA